MDKTLLFSSANPEILNDALRQAAKADFQVETKNALPSVSDFESAFPDVLLVDFDLISDSKPLFLEDVSEKVPLIKVYVLADSTVPEETLFPLLKFGCRGWIFHERGRFDLQELSKIVQEGHFLKPFVAERLLGEFRKVAEGETLGAVEEEILRKAALGTQTDELERSLNLQPKMLSVHWGSIWRKLNINARARHELTASSESRILAAPAANQTNELGVAGAPAARLHLVGFRVGGEAFAFEINDLEEIQRVMSITPIPKAPSCFLGIANLRGTILPVIDLRIKLELEAHPLTKEARIIVVNVDGKRVGILVDEVSEVIRANALDVKAPPALVMNPNVRAIKGVLHDSGRLILLLDLRELLGAESPHSIAVPQAVIG